MCRSRVLQFLLAFALLFLFVTASVAEVTHATTDPETLDTDSIQVSTTDFCVYLPQRSNWSVNLKNWADSVRSVISKLPTAARLQVAVRDTVGVARNWFHNVYLAPHLEFKLLLDAPRLDCPPRESTTAFDGTISDVIPEDALTVGRFDLRYVIRSAAQLTAFNMVAVQQALLESPHPEHAALQQYRRTEKSIHHEFYRRGLTRLSNARYYIIDCIRDSIQTVLREQFKMGIKDILDNKCRHATDIAMCYDIKLSILGESLANTWLHNDRQVKSRASVKNSVVRLSRTVLRTSRATVSSRAAAVSRALLHSRSRWSVNIKLWTNSVGTATSELPIVAHLQSIRATIDRIRIWAHDAYLAPYLEIRLLFDAPHDGCPPIVSTTRFDTIIRGHFPGDALSKTRTDINRVIRFAARRTARNMPAVQRTLLQSPVPQHAALEQYQRTEKSIHRAFYRAGLTRFSNPSYRIVDCVRDTIQTDMRKKFKLAIEDMLGKKCRYATNTTTCYDDELSALGESFVDIWLNNDREVKQRASGSWNVNRELWLDSMRNTFSKLLKSPLLTRFQITARNMIDMVRSWFHDVYLTPYLEFKLLLNGPRSGCPSQDLPTAFDSRIRDAIPEDALSEGRTDLNRVLRFAMRLTAHNMDAVRHAMLAHPDPQHAALQQYKRTEKSIHRAFYRTGLTRHSNPRYHIIDCIRDSIQTDLRQKFKAGIRDILDNKCRYERDDTRCYDVAFATLSGSVNDVWLYNARQVNWRASVAHTFVRLLRTSLIAQGSFSSAVYIFWYDIVEIIRYPFIVTPYWIW
ncbi:hypothetical protein BCR43DRAFT_489420 [Syncephalastrum racemosum]|uniref:Uncharacterized protein n=1 Tax=Syncephalastrum racemosum TaxID=13706 RepID=A0A1X2HE87_SYNRA|nr:hypothetical protein BCR43DRAFT_489420 [Syncephalastrum racemosum]